MAKKNSSKSVTPVRRGEAWSPDRPMGLARALNKAGWSTRRLAIEMTEAGRFSVDGEKVNDPLFPVTPESKILFDGKELVLDKKNYYVFHKPIRVVCGAGEPGGRKSVRDFFPTWISGLQAAGRLDGRTTGLMVVSNDPAWNNRVASELKPEQEFRVQVEGELGDIEVGVMSAGIHLAGMGIFRPLSVKIIETMNRRTIMSIVTKEGKARQIRRMFSTLRHKITFLRRVRIGEIRLGDLPAGGIRPLTAKEILFVRDCPVAAEPSVNRKTQQEDRAKKGGKAGRKH
jgi:23S rRNA pseudouridine2605 synthase